MGKKRVAPCSDSMEPEPEPLCSCDVTHPSKFRRMRAFIPEHQEDQVGSALSGATGVHHGQGQLLGNSTNSDDDIEILVVPDSSSSSSASPAAMPTNLSREEVLSLIPHHHWLSDRQHDEDCNCFCCALLRSHGML